MSSLASIQSPTRQRFKLVWPTSFATASKMAWRTGCLRTTRQGRHTIEHAPACKQHLKSLPWFRIAGVWSLWPKSGLLARLWKKAVGGWPPRCELHVYALRDDLPCSFTFGCQATREAEANPLHHEARYFWIRVDVGKVLSLGMPVFLSARPYGLASSPTYIYRRSAARLAERHGRRSAADGFYSADRKGKM